MRTIGELAGLPGAAVAERLGQRTDDGAWSLARGEHRRRVNPRQPARRLVETLEFPDAVGAGADAAAGLGVLVDRLLANPERAGRPPRKLALWARLVGGSLLAADGDAARADRRPERLRLALGPKLAELPAPVLKLRLEAVELAEERGEQLELLRAEGEARQDRLQQGLRQVRAAVGTGGISTVVEVAPWSRIPEARALLVPRDD